ncbi:hypothetical protein [Ensifer adhaerens]|jgi:hypothetical protein|uniref:hypothetical protein n=1 Tax=Ensifer adhaerens TaxID=106592 RepID=UPI002030587D|nr:hypothetical protein [Ensifer adhaerens]
MTEITMEMRWQPADGAPVAWQQFLCELETWCCELPDRTSPEDAPEMMLFDRDELHMMAEKVRDFLSTAQPASDRRFLSLASLDVLEERDRQKSVEGWSTAHDDQHIDNELSRAAASYTIGNLAYWPWSPAWWKPSDRRRNLVKAGALIIAEIERLDRAAFDATDGGAK